jgi:hypothetical protein
LTNINVVAKRDKGNESLNVDHDDHVDQHAKTAKKLTNKKGSGGAPFTFFSIA